MPLHEALTREIRESPAGAKVAALFDVDGTLWAGFSATAFFRERLRSGSMPPRELAETLIATFGYLAGRQSFSGLVGAHAAAYRGLSERVVQELGEDVFQRYMAAAIYPEARALVRAHQARGHTIAIVSSATPYQVEPLARDLGVPHVLCTRLEVENGVMTGGVVRPTCFGPGKVAAAEQLAGEHDLDLEQSFFYSDSSDDLLLLERVGRPRPLNPDSRLERLARERDWPVRRFVSRGRPGAGDLLRTALSYGSLLPAAIGGAAVGLLNRSQRDMVNMAGSLWGDLSTALAGIQLRVEGEEHLWSHRPAVFIFNHQSGVDAPLMARLVRRDFTGIAKQELRRHPIFGPAFQAAGVVFIDRANRSHAIEAMRPAVQALRNGISIVIAPEGTRRPTPTIGPFKKGAFHLALQARVPIVPVVFRNALDALPRGATVIRPATVEAVVLPPIDTSGWTREGLSDEIAKVRQLYVDVLARD